MTTDDHPLWLWFTYNDGLKMAGATLSKSVKMAIPQHLRRSARGVLMALAVTSVGHRSSILVLKNDFSDPKKGWWMLDDSGALKQIFWICFDQIKSHAWISRVHFHPYFWWPVTTPKHQRVAALFLASVSLDDHSVVALWTSGQYMSSVHGNCPVCQT